MSKKTNIYRLLQLLLLVCVALVIALWACRRPSGKAHRSSNAPSPGQYMPGALPDPDGANEPGAVSLPTVMFPTPDTPVPYASIIPEDQAIALAFGQNPDYAAQLERGELSVTTRLTVHGDRQAGTTGDLAIHPQLPVWIIYLHVAPWTQWVGPEGGRIEVQYNVIWYEIDANTGKLLGGGRSFLPEEIAPTASL